MCIISPASVLVVVRKVTCKLKIPSQPDPVHSRRTEQRTMSYVKLLIVPTTELGGSEMADVWRTQRADCRLNQARTDASEYASIKGLLWQV